MRYQTVLFDLDGTLIDSAEMILTSLRHATKTVLGREIPDDELRSGIGRTLVSHMHELDPERADDLIRVYSDHNIALHAELRPFDGVLDVIATLSDEGRKLGIVTSKRRDTVDVALELLAGLAAHFDVVVAAEDTKRHKPHPDPILLALDRLGTPAASAAYVGDSPVDVQAAKAAGVAAIAVAWGRLHIAERLAQEEPDALAETPEELLGHLG